MEWRGLSLPSTHFFGIEAGMKRLLASGLPQLLFSPGACAGLFLSTCPQFAPQRDPMRRLVLPTAGGGLVSLTRTRSLLEV